MISYVSNRIWRKFRACIRWRRPARTPRIRILGEHRSGLGRLVEIERALQQEVGTWKFIPSSPNSGHDVLICLDRWDPMQLQLRNNFDAGSGGSVGPMPTHTITVIQLGRIPGENRAVKASVVFHGSLDLVGNQLGPPEAGDRKAKAILRAAVKQLLRYDDQIIDWLATIEDYLDLYEERTRGRVRGF